MPRRLEDRGRVARRAHILDHLFAQAHNVSVQCRVRWQAGDLVFYDNRCTQHIAVSDYTERRIMHSCPQGIRPV